MNCARLSLCWKATCAPCWIMFMPLDEAEIANLYGQTHHLIRLVNDLRELSLAESGQLPLETAPCDVNAIVNETLQALEPLCSGERNPVWRTRFLRYLK